MMTLNEWRRKHTYRTLSDAVGVSEQYMSLLATGRRRPSAELAKRITQATYGLVTFEEETDE